MRFCIAQYNIETMGENTAFGIYPCDPRIARQFFLVALTEWEIQGKTHQGVQY
jgi:hypothetical protein